MNSLNDDFWSHKYLDNQTRWDLGEVSPPIKSYIDQLTEKNIKILIPGCGNSYEAQYLLSQGFDNITVIDISKVLTDALRKKFSNEISHHRMKVLHSDFFEHTGQYDLIIEQTFFCAIDPLLRPLYVEKMQQLLTPQGRLVGLLFDVLFEGGPPFGGDYTEYVDRFSKHFKNVSIAPCYNSAIPRQGGEFWINISQKKNLF